ncbi:MAG: response regulator [Oscillospiraceae bacterium]
MKILAADDEVLALEMLTQALGEACPDAEIFSFTKLSKLLVFAANTTCDVAFIDIQMPGMTGLELAKKLKIMWPNINIIFVTGFDEYTKDALAMHVSGYIMKPVTVAKIEVELANLRHPIPQKRTAVLKVKSLGNFDVFTPTGELVHFERTKAKEVLAYLVYRRGASCTVKEIAAALFEDEEYDKKQQNYLQKIISSLLQTLNSIGAEAVIVKKYNSLAVDVTLLECDYYQFIERNSTTINEYSGEFMSQYPWAEFVVGYLEEIYRNK